MSQGSLLFDEHYVNEYTHSWSFSMTGKKIFEKPKILLLFGKDILKLETVLSFQDKNLCVVFKFKPHRIIETFFSTSLNLRFYNVKTGSCKLSILYISRTYQSTLRHWYIDSQRSSWFRLEGTYYNSFFRSKIGIHYYPIQFYFFG